MSQLDGKVAIVTGGSRGIGAATAIRLADEGANVAFTYLDSTTHAERVRERITSRGGRAIAVRADAGDPASPALVVERAVEEFGGLDILVNNAGMLMGAELRRITVAQIDRMFAVNVRGAMLAAQAASGHLRAGGRVITVGSVGATWFPQPMGTLYGMTKAALSGLTKGLARDLGPLGVTVNLIEPGAVETDMMAADGDDGPMDVPLLPLMAVGRFGKPEEIASLIVFLSSAEAGFVTGATLVADGGLTL